MNTVASEKVRILCTNGLKSVFEAIGGALTEDTGIGLAIDFGSTKKFTDQIAGGDVPDLAILTDEAVDALIAQGKLAGRRIDIARSFIGVAVRRGAPRPDISTPDAFIRTLKTAKSISRSRVGQSGMHLEALLKQLGLADELSPKIKVYDGRAAQACAEGEVEMAIQQIAELMPAGLDIVGPLPDAFQKISMFSAGLGAGAHNTKAAEAIVAYIKGKERAGVLRTKGLEPA